MAGLRKVRGVGEPAGRWLDPQKAKQKIDEWMRPKIIDARSIGLEAARQAVQGLIESGLMSSLADVSRSYIGTKARAKVRNPKGAKRSLWREKTAVLFLNKRFMNKLPSHQEIIDRMLNDSIIQQAQDDSYVDFETGRNVAPNFRYLCAEISKIKSAVLKDQ